MACSIFLYFRTHMKATFTMKKENAADWKIMWIVVLIQFNINPKKEVVCFRMFDCTYLITYIAVLIDFQSEFL